MPRTEQPSTEIIDMRRLARRGSPLLPNEAEIVAPHLSTSHYLWVVFRYRWQLLGFVLFCSLATYIFSARQTRIYEATAIVEVDRQMPSGVLGPDAGQAMGMEDSDQFLATQAELITSDAVVRPVVEKFDLLNKERELAHVLPDKEHRTTEAPVALSRLKVSRTVDTYILRISYQSSDPRLAADVANAVAESYLKHTFEIRVRSSGALSAFMEKQLDELRARMERSNLALARFEGELSVIDPETRTNILSSRLVQLNTEFTSAQADRVRKEADWKAIQSGSLAAAQVSTQGVQLPSLYDRLNVAKQHLATVSTVFGPNHSEYKKAANDLAEVQRQFEEMRRNVMLRVETDYHEAEAREQMLAKAVADSKAEWDRINSHSFEYQRLKRDAEADKTLYADLERRIREAGINAGFHNSSIRIADLARPTDYPIFPRTGRATALAFAVSLILGLCFAILLDVLDNSIRDPEQAARALDTTVIGALPAVKGIKRLGGGNDDSPDEPARSHSQPWNGGEDHFPLRQLAANAASTGHDEGRPGRRGTEDVGDKPRPFEGMSAYEEAIRTVRHAILLPDFDRSLRSLLVTSATPGEGKSTATIHLAIAHAEQGKRTLIIDADLRRPSVHKRLGLDGLIGLSNVLLGEVPWKDALLKARRYKGLDVLPAGMASRRASDLVGSMMIDILDEASKEYDLIFVDAPPLIGFAEAMQIATAVDGVVVIARAGQTSRKAVASVLATLSRLRANVIGLVLNQVNKNTSQAYYYYNEYRKYYAEAPDESS